MLGRTPFGRGQVKLEWEVKPLGELFDGKDTGQSASWQDTGTAGVELNELVDGLARDTAYHWRVRLRYHPAGTPFQQASRWLTMPWNGWEEQDLSTSLFITETRVITYTYDGLYRLTGAEYSSGESFLYDYDKVGNRTSMTATITSTAVTTYTYDAANRLTHVNGVAQTWDARGNLLEDFAGTEYTYDVGNQLVKAVQGGVTYEFAYNALGDRLQQTVAGEVTTYTLDLFAGLTQVLWDGDNAYLYGLGRIGEEQPTGWAYYLPDALGSVRQLADEDGDVTLARSYKPYGGALETDGTSTAAYGYTGEWTDGTGLVFLRARFLDPAVGRFLTRDPWGGSRMRPSTLNDFLYTGSNPISMTDPSGMCDQPPCYVPPGLMNPVGLPELSAGLAVQLAKMVYWKVGPLRICFLSPDDGQSPSDTVNDLLTDFVCEYGPDYRFFGADARLTQELARTATIHLYRQGFYLLGDQVGHGIHYLEIPQFLLATFDLLMEPELVKASGALSVFNITHFLGSFDYEITQEGDEVRFWTRNVTDLASGSRMPQPLGGADPNLPGGTSVESILAQEPNLAGRPLRWVVENRPVVSILEARGSAERGQDWLQGGGEMTQVFRWCEPYPVLGCTPLLPPLPVVWQFLTISDCKGGGGGAAGFG